MMPCYVDQPLFPFRGRVMCHLWADTEAELLAMADRIGLERRWIQGHPTLSQGKARAASWLHFDIAKDRRARAIAAGAIETDRYGALHFEARRRGRTEKVAQIEALRVGRGQPADGIVRGDGAA